MSGTARLVEIRVSSNQTTKLPEREKKKREKKRKVPTYGRWKTNKY